MQVGKKFFLQFDWILFGAMMLLCLVGVGVLYSAGFDPETGTSPAVKRQLVSMLIGLGMFLVCMLIGNSTWRSVSYLIYFVCCGLLLATLVSGTSAGGAQRWLVLGGIRLQPSELMKVGLILALAKYLSSDRAPRDGYTIVSLIVPSLILVLPFGLILKQPDLGTALCHLLIGGSMLFLAGIKTKTFIRLFLAGMLLVLPAWKFVLKDYQKKRVLTFMSPEADPLGSGYHAIQSKIAVGSGAVTGKGFLKGTQTQLSFLPEQTTDFVFSVLAEEWGFVGSVLVLSLYCVLIMRLFRLGARSEDTFASYVAFGAAALLFWHTFVNIGMVIGILPVVGLTLSLFSYGGSSLVTSMALIGIATGLSIKRRFF